MIDLFIPYIFGLALGIDAPGRDAAPPVVPSATAATDITGTGDDMDASRPAEDQTPTGRFTTATEVRPILDVTRANWVGVRDYNGQDYVYFTHLLAWRCGLWDIRYGFNGAPADNVLAMEPCYAETTTPNAITDVANFLPYVIRPAGSVTSVTVEIVYDDGTAAEATFDRAAIAIP
ncbi:hypothetical protein [Pseudooctadecabacter jejudonensis]|uniref:Uncharacterized protein n=1 Tax=Pseudooctadecabacter jejudonensis TaxID=1391910 RepID=A0A1Y5RLZ5_9RHOB|nr:hypothetical protein [Pseudooctadecabacter jejudonensis]SLN20598.1 hypothetical protein PSJ8397_00772 [Pseudooctadecabacter jejudonensis]